MKTTRARFILALLLIVSCNFAFMYAAEPQEPIRHVVVFKYKDDAPQEKIQAITDAFRDLQDEIPGIVSFEHGVNNSPEGLNRGLTHVYQLTFEDAAARDAYLPHPAHKAFGQKLRDSGIFEEVFVVDYVPKK